MARKTPKRIIKIPRSLASVDSSLVYGHLDEVGIDLSEHPFHKAKKILTEDPALNLYPSKDQRWRISLRHLNRWRINNCDEFQTLAFEIMDEDESTQVFN